MCAWPARAEFPQPESLPGCDCSREASRVYRRECSKVFLRLSYLGIANQALLAQSAVKKINNSPAFAELSDETSGELLTRQRQRLSLIGRYIGSDEETGCADDFSGRANRFVVRPD